MKLFTLPEKARFVLLYERSGRDYEEFRLAARRKWNLRDWNLPPRSTLNDWVKKFEETGSLEAKTPVRERLIKQSQNRLLSSSASNCLFVEAGHK